MTNNKRKIVWEKWMDPYGENIENEEWPGAFGTFESDAVLEKIKQMEENGSSEEDWNELEYDMMEGKADIPQPIPSKPMKLLATPMGVVPLTEYSTPSRVFNFWVAHSNFRITKEIQDLLDNTDGVEILDVFTPYRWRIAIGKAFNSQEVKENIMRNLDVTIEHNE